MTETQTPLTSPSDSGKPTRREKSKNIREILHLAIPAATEKLLLLFTGMVSMMIVGKISDDTLVAVSMCNTIYGTVQAVFMGLSLGAAIHIARQYSIGDKKAAESTMLHMILLNTVIGAFFTFLLAFYGRGFIGLLFNQLDEGVISLTLRFLGLTVFAVPFIGIDCAISASLRGAGNAKLPLYLTLLVNIINVAIGYVTVYIFHMGINGAALAFLISRSFGGIIRLLLVLFGGRKIEIRLSAQTLSLRRFWAIISCGGITMFEQFMLQIGFLGMQVITSHISKEAIGGYQIANSAINLVYSLTFGFETAAITTVGAYLGRNEKTKARSTAYTVLWMTEITTCILGVFIYLFAEQFLMLFSDKPAMIDAGVSILRLLVFSVPITSMFQGISGTLKTGGRAKIVLILNIIGPWGIRIPLAYYLCVVCKLDIVGLMTGLFVDYSVRAVCYFISLRREKWLTAKV